MEPIDPSGKWPGWQRITIAKNYVPYNPLPSVTDGQEVVTEWGFSFAERLKILFGCHLHYSVLTFGRAFPPVRFGIVRQEQTHEDLRPKQQHEDLLRQVYALGRSEAFMEMEIKRKLARIPPKTGT